MVIDINEATNLKNAEVMGVAEDGNVAIEELESTKPYILRNPQAKDISPFLKLLSKIGIRELKNIVDNEKIKALVEKTGTDEEAGDSALEALGIGFAFELADIVVERLSDCQAEVFKVLSCLSNMSADEISRLDLSMFLEMVYDVIKLPGFVDFTKVASRLLLKKQ